MKAADKFPEYLLKVENFKQGPLYRRLRPETKTGLDPLLELFPFTEQELRFLGESARDLEQWHEIPLGELWAKLEKLRPESEPDSDPRRSKKSLLQRLQGELLELRRQAKVYPADGLPQNGASQPPEREVVIQSGQDLVLGPCPVFSDQTSCCGLKTLDVVESCPFSCSYCSIQTFYDGKIVLHSDLEAQLQKLAIDPDSRCHVGIGQASDALAWGNREGILDALYGFARRYPKMLLELKSKAAQVDYFLDHSVPPNLVCSWTLNTPTIVKNEEHLTASVEERLNAARRVADTGAKIAFHFHPLVYYQGWKNDYLTLAERLLESFDPGEIVFISLGTVTLIKPVLKAIRERGISTKISQMELTPDPHGRLTYPDPIKIELYQALLGALAPWKDEVYIYLCMEKTSIWHSAMGRAYFDNTEFEQDLLARAFDKITQ